MEVIAITVIQSDSEESYNIQTLTYIILFTDTFNINILIINNSLFMSYPCYFITCAT